MGSSIVGPFEQTNFCGASVINFSSSIGWNEQSSMVTVNLAEDKGQRFTMPAMGTPQKFQFGGFKFEGLVQRWLKKNAIDGMPTYEITLTDPREILAGAQCILSSYRGNIGPFKNLLNVFGYWEKTLGFGGALVNESGMVWNAPFEVAGLNPKGGLTITPVDIIGILPAIHVMTSGGHGDYGGPLSLMGHNYKVDLSDLPVPPAYYRMGGVSSSILDMVSQICQDGGHDYICILEDHTIRFKCVSRVNQADPGMIANFIYGREDVISNSIGVEFRNDVTNAILLGGDVSMLVQELNPFGDQTIWPYWGLDFNENVIIGEGKPEEGNHKFKLNAVPIADIVGDLIYPCDIAELRFALVDFDSWSAYVMKYYPDKSKAINLVSIVDSTSELAEFFPDVVLQHDLIADRQEEMDSFGRMNESESEDERKNYWTERVQRVYEFVRGYATEYFGKKFLVRIPFNIYWNLEPETGHRVSSYEPTDGGFYPEGGRPMGLAFENETIFLTSDGRFQCFVGFSDVPNADIQRLPPDSFVVQDKTVYMRASIDTDAGILYAPGSVFPYVVVTLDSPVYQIPADPLGSVSDIAAMLEIDIESIVYAAGERHGSFPIKIHPSPYRPDGVCVPLKSNTDSYGPWFTSGGVDGKVSFERDEGLVPWNYGDFQTMIKAAEAKLANAATQMQYQETGSVEMAGAPEHSLGDSLVLGGPQLTGIDVSVGTDGVKTSYRMQTYTPRFGAFTKDNADRLRRMGMAAVQMRRSIRNLFQTRATAQRIITSAQLGFMANTSRAVSQRSPHWALVGKMTYSDKYGYRTQVSTQSAQEAIANVRGDDPDKYVMTGCISLEGLLRPFSTNDANDREKDDTKNDLPHYTYIDPDRKIYPVSVKEFNPFDDGCDVDYMIYGDEYPGRVHRLKQDPDYTNARGLGLRGPIIQVGWGYSYTGKPLPNKDFDPLEETPKKEHEWGNEFLEDHRKKPERWSAGPVGLFFDFQRGVWTIPTILIGKLDSDLTADNVNNLTPTDNNPGTFMTIYLRDMETQDKVRVYCSKLLGGDFKKNQGVVVSFDQQAHKWIITSAGCPPQ